MTSAQQQPISTMTMSLLLNSIAGITMLVLRGMKSVLCLLGVLLVQTHGWAASNLSADAEPPGFRVYDLRTDYRVNPLGLEARHLHFFWRITSGYQSAWQIQAASTSAGLAGGGADLWDSGKRDGAATTLIAYEGKPPASRQRAWWRVRAWDAAGKASPWSEPAWFEMGLLNESDWHQAQWIGSDRDLAAPALAPTEVMGEWISGPAGQACTSYFVEIRLPDKPVVSAMTWWDQSRAAQGGVVVNLETVSAQTRGAMARACHRGQFGFLDHAFYLQPGKDNRIEFLFPKAEADVAATIGLRIVFTDGEEMVVKSGADWKASQTGPDGGRRVLPVTVADSYAGPRHGKARMMRQTSMPPTWFRSGVKVEGELAHARLYVSALGCGRAAVNGAFADDDLLTPPQSDYEAAAFYKAYDVTALLHSGENAMAVQLDGSWYHQVGGFGGFSYGKPGLKALLALDYADGRSARIVSGPDWQWKEGEILEANIYRGDTVDYRRGHEEWMRPHAGRGWKAAQVLSPRTPKLLPMDVAPVRAIREIRPVRQWRVGLKTWMYDVGEMIHGGVKIRLNETSGTVVRIRYTEAAEAGRLRNVPRSHWWCHGVTQGDTITCDGRPHTFQPVFSTKSFRFFEVSGLSRQPAPDDLAAVAIHTDAEVLAAFESSDPMLNRLFQNGIRTFANYLNHMFGDIPRERCLWGAESIYSWNTAFNCFDWAPNHRLMAYLWMTGRMTKDGIPGNIGLGQRLSTAPSSLLWGGTPVFLTSRIYQHYGDLSLAKEFLGLMRKILLHYETEFQRGGIDALDGLSDHAPAKDIPRQPANGGLINAMALHEMERGFALLADALGRREEAAQARAVAERVHAGVMALYDPARHTFGNGTQDSLALAYDVIDSPDERKALAASLAGYYRNNGHRFDGGFMSYEIYPMLSRFGYGDDAIKMVRNPDYPGPAWSVAKYDATSYWEAYYLDEEFQGNRGLDFIAFAHPTGWMITDLAGIRPDPAVAAGRRLIMEPAVPKTEKLDWVKASLKTAQGVARSVWKLDGGKLVWEITVPPNTTASIGIPAKSGGAVKGAEAMKAAGFSNGRCRFEAKAGTYRLESDVERLDQLPALPDWTKPAARVKDATLGSPADWRNAKGVVPLAANGLVLGGGNADSLRMLTTSIPRGAGPYRIRLTVHSSQAFSGRIEPVWQTKGQPSQARTREALPFRYDKPGAWQTVEMTTSNPGQLFSLWITVTTQVPVEIAAIEMALNTGDMVRRWDFVSTKTKKTDK